MDADGTIVPPDVNLDDIKIATDSQAYPIGHNSLSDLWDGQDPHYLESQLKTQADAEPHARAHAHSCWDAGWLRDACHC